MKMTLSAIALSLSTLLSLSLPAQAAIQGTSNLAPGSWVGVGLFGLSYDYGFPRGSLGLVVANDMGIISPRYGSQGGFKIGARGVWSFFEEGPLTAGIIGGVEFDPGAVGQRAFLTPDLGVALAYRLKISQFPDFILRLNMTLASRPNNNSYYPAMYPDDENKPIVPNFFQSLSIGPNTSMELAIAPSDTLEITFGGGTLIGMRMRF